VAEAFFCIKERGTVLNQLKPGQEFYECVNNYILFYNTARPHGALAYKTPGAIRDDISRKTEEKAF